MPADALQSSTVEIAGPVGKVSAYMTRPADSGERPAVVVIHEWWGLNDHIKDLARRFAREGYVAVAPDLYSRLGNPVATDANEAAKLMTSLQKPDGAADLLAVLRHLESAPGVRGDRIGVTGYCMGGSYTLLSACLSPNVKAAAAFYGEIPDNATLATLRAPLLYVYGSEDGWIQLRDVERLRDTLRAQGTPATIQIYPGAPHGFFNDTRREVYREVEARDAWQRTLRLFATELNG